MKNDMINIIMKTTKNCNLKCKYCYQGESINKIFDMSIETVERVLQMVMPNYDKVKFVWHGGEPLLLSSAFYQEVVDLQSEYSSKIQSKVRNIIQTNGILLDKDRVNFFKNHEFQVALSYDGQFNEDTRGNSVETLNAVEHLKKKNMNVGAKCVIGSHNINDLFEIYHHFNDKEINLTFGHMFYLGNAKETDYCIYDYREYLDRMKELFEYWIYDQNCRIILSPFETDTYLLLHDQRRSCINCDCAENYISIDPNGDIYPCARPFVTDFNFGNIYEINDLAELFESKNYQTYKKLNDLRHEKCKKTCEFYYYCLANCNNQADFEKSIDEIPGFTCSYYREMLKYIKTRLNDIRIEIFEKGNMEFNPFLINAFLYKKRVSGFHCGIRA